MTLVASMPLLRMGLPPRSFVVDAHGCIMVRIPTGFPEYKIVARTRVQLASLVGSFVKQRGGTADVPA
jgi:hypothetical protein